VTEGSGQCIYLVYVSPENASYFPGVTAPPYTVTIDSLVEAPE
jgi:hypothetical protein